MFPCTSAVLDFFAKSANRARDRLRYGLSFLSKLLFSSLSHTLVQCLNFVEAVMTTRLTLLALLYYEVLTP